MSDTGKRLVRTSICIIVPLIYTTASLVYPDIPFTSEGVVDIALWVAGGLIGGWNIKKIINGGTIK